MRILFVGSLRGHDTSQHYFTNLVRLGHTVLPFSPDFFRGRNPVEQALIRLRRRPTVSVEQSIARELEAICKESAWDLVFVMGETFFGAEVLRQLKRARSGHAPIFIFHSHDNVFAEGILKGRDFFDSLREYDFVFTTKSQNISRYQAHGQANAHYLPSAFEPTVHHPIPVERSRLASKLEVSFVGTYDASRVPLLEAVGWERLHVWGDRWNRYPVRGTYSDRIHSKAAYYFEFADILSHSKVSLGLLREEAQDRHTQRTFEIPACGALQMCPRNEEVLGFFEEDKECVFFGSIDELLEKVTFYLENEKARQKIAEAGHKRVLADRHTYQDRVRTILDIVS